ncbi:hypothetical protein PTTG_30894, partial [Puccinia triticina 1-1 BBBD Race 1]
MYWLRKLNSSRMTGDDVTAHLDEMTQIYEQLTSVITPTNPLTPEDIFASDILNSLPSDWLSCVSSMLNEPKLEPVKLIQCLKAEHLRRKTRAEDPVSSEQASRVSTRPPSASRKPRTAFNRDLYCLFCRRNGHNLEICENAAKILADHDRHTSSPSDRRREGTDRTRYPTGSRSNKKPAAKAGKTTVVELGGAASGDDSDYSGSEVDTYAKSAASHRSGRSHARANNAVASNATLVKRE